MFVPGGCQNLTTVSSSQSNMDYSKLKKKMSFIEWRRTLWVSIHLVKTLIADFESCFSIIYYDYIKNSKTYFRQLYTDLNIHTFTIYKLAHNILTFHILYRWVLNSLYKINNFTNFMKHLPCTKSILLQWKCTSCTYRRSIISGLNANRHSLPLNF